MLVENVRRILCIGAHADDIEIGCGGTLLRLLGHSQIEVCWVVFSGGDDRKEEASNSAEVFLRNAASYTNRYFEFSDGFFPAHWAQLKDAMAEIAEDFNPDLVFTHRLEDRHQDHRTLSELTWNHFRRQQIWEYEIPKYEGDLSTPNVYVELTEAQCEEKIGALLDCFSTQAQRPWFDQKTFWSMLRIRGLESGRASGFAEGFTVRKIAI